MTPIPITDHDKLTVLTKLSHYSEANRISVEVLCLDLKVSRRKLRAIVNEINSDESPEYAHKMILTDTDEGGYWLAARGSDPSPAYHNVASELSRGTDITRKARAMERKITRIYGTAQEGLF